MKIVKKLFSIINYTCLVIIVLCINVYGYTQPLSNKKAWDKLIEIEKKDDAVNNLERVLVLKKQFEDNHLNKDSVYARILHKAGLWYSDTKELNLAITNTLEAIKINLAGKPGSSRKFAVNSYNNLALIYKDLSLLDKALICFDSAIFIARPYSDLQQKIVEMRVDKCNILFIKGDYEKYREEATTGEIVSQKIADTFHLIIFLNHRAQANLFENRSTDAIKDVESALNLAGKLQQPDTNVLDEKATSLKIKALANAQQKNTTLSISLFKMAIALRTKTGKYEKVANDYTDFGNFFLNTLHDYTRANECYLKTAEYAKQVTNNKEILSKAHLNTGFVYFSIHDYKKAERYYLKAFDDLQLNARGNVLINSTSKALNAVGNKELVSAMLNNKTELLLQLYKQTRNTQYLDACLQTAFVMDSVITQTRFNQSAEQSKLYWRNRTREFFSNAVEASYLANKPATAFFFMEKSRAVLLNDKLNELGATVKLPVSETLKQQVLQDHILEQQQKLAVLNDSTNLYREVREKLLRAKEEFDNYISSLEQKYPLYYQYKYDDKVPSLDSLQHFLSANKQSFVYYFTNDTVAYILCITPGKTNFIKLPKSDFSGNQLQIFSQFCADRENLNHHYSSFISLSNSIYKLLFLPLQIPRGRVAICPDNFLIPFEALCTDTAGNNFLINDYAFSYVYSARYLMKKNFANEAKGNFIGFAPVTFQSYPNKNDLMLSDISLQKCASYYSNAVLYTKSRATRSNFLNAVAGYKIVNIFSHASADTTGAEPVLFMYDTIIKLSELQMFQNHEANLVILSACETDVGKNAIGEGIYSLARGFSAVGIPSVAATLWNADAKVTYAVTEKFHAYLSAGLPKDEALQKAKLFYIQNNNKTTPYFWANMIMVGNTDPIQLVKEPAFYKRISGSWWLIISAAVVSVCAILFTLRHRIKRKSSVPDGQDN